LRHEDSGESVISTQGMGQVQNAVEVLLTVWMIAMASCSLPTACTVILGSFSCIDDVGDKNRGAEGCGRAQ
jgi:hypothetical protein